MFLHVFTYRFKCIVHDRQMMFWTLGFSIILASLFGMAFSNLSKDEDFSNIPIAVVNNAEYQSNTAFQQALNSVSGKASGEQRMFNVKLATQDKAEDLLKNSKIDGYILLDNGAKVVVKQSGMTQTILKSFVDDYLQTGSAYQNIISQNPASAQRLLADSGNSDAVTLRDVPVSKSKPNNTLVYYYALIAMACLYGGFHGMNEVNAIQANLTPQGARMNMVPAHKIKIFAYSLCAATAVQLLSILITLAYLNLVLKVDLGGNLPYILLACLAGTMAGVSFGAMIGAIFKTNQGLKIALLIVITMVLSFLSGLMVNNMKYIVTSAVPALAYLNPANLIADSFYSLYYYDTYTRYFTNVGLLFGFTAVFYLITYFVLRRQKYASL